MADYNHWHVVGDDDRILATFPNPVEAEQKARAETGSYVRGCDCLEYTYEKHNEPVNPGP